MDKLELKMRLDACRPSGQDNDDGAIREALAQLPADAELAVWFARSQALDAAVSRQLAGVKAPDGLRGRILAGARVNARRNEWRRHLWIAAAAIVMAGAAVWMLENYFSAASEGGGALAAATLREYRDEVASVYAGMHQTGFELDHSDADVAKVKQWLAEHGAPADAVLRAGLTDALPFGCKIVEWRGRKVSMMCFGKNDDEAHLFVVSRDAIRGLGGIEAGRVERVGGFEIIAWQDERRAYVMVGDSPKTDLKPFL